MNSVEQVTALYQSDRLRYLPEAFYTYRPRLDGSGTALKLNLRIQPEIEEGEKGAFVKSVAGGLFIDLAGQNGPVAKGTNPTFDWQGTNRVTAKLCMPDLLAWQVGMRAMRETQGMLAFEKRALPAAMQNNREPDQEKARKQIVLFHKFRTSTTAITITFEAEGSSISISKPPKEKGGTPLRKSTTLSLTEEYAVARYLDQALDVFLRVGLR